MSRRFVLALLVAGVSGFLWGHQSSANETNTQPAKRNPIRLSQMKSFFPDTFVGLDLWRIRGFRSGIPGEISTHMEATYGKPKGQQVRLAITDNASAGEGSTWASWAQSHFEKEDDAVVERVYRLNGRVIKEKVVKKTGENHCHVIVAQRFLVAVESRDKDEASLRSAVETLELDRLESLKRASPWIRKTRDEFGLWNSQWTD